MIETLSTDPAIAVPAPRPLHALDAAIAKLSGLAPRPIDVPGRALAPGVALQFKGDSGLRGSIGGGGAGFAVALHDRGDSPWFSLEFALPPEALRAARFLGARLGGSCAAGAVTLRPVLRLSAEDGWHDTAFSRDLVFTASPADSLALLPLEEVAGRDEAHAATLIFFVRQRTADLRLTRIEPFCAA
jgi:hypothetical protein